MTKNRQIVEVNFTFPSDLRMDLVCIMKKWMTNIAQEIKHVLREFGRIWEQISENSRLSQGFSPAREFSKNLPRFSPGYGGTENMFYFFYKIIIFSLDKEKDDIWSVCVYLSFFHETVNSYNLETANHIAYIISVLPNAKKTHLLTNKNAGTI